MQILPQERLPPKAGKDTVVGQSEIPSHSQRLNCAAHYGGPYFRKIQFLSL
jgi:hypothetical protein